MKDGCRKRLFRAAGFALLLALAAGAAARAAEVTVVTSGAFTAAFLEIVPEFERATHNHVIAQFGPSMGKTPNAIPLRLERGEALDVVIMAAPALAELVKQGKVRPDIRVDLVRSKIGMAVRTGAARPDIRTVSSLKETLLAAKSIAYSDSASGVYLSTELFPRLGIADQIKSKARVIEGAPVGEAVANGEAEIGFQQISELRPVKGIDIVGELPPGAQRITIFAAGIPATSKQTETAKAFIQWLASPAAYPAIAKSGLEPVSPK